MLDIEYILLERYHWSLYELDRTDIESLLPYFFYMAEKASGGRSLGSKLEYCDQVNWL